MVGGEYQVNVEGELIFNGEKSFLHYTNKNIIFDSDQQFDDSVMFYQLITCLIAQDQSSPVQLLWPGPDD